jgi:hypothetical protein
MSNNLRHRSFMFLTVCAIAATLALASHPAGAQFVCDKTGVGGADGASASGGGSVACGTNAQATSAGTAVGNSAHATNTNTTASAIRCNQR